MSVAELLPAIRALPKAEQVELIHLLIDGVTEVSPTSNEVPESLATLLPSGAVFDVWFPDPNVAAVEAAQLLLDESRVTGE